MHYDWLTFIIAALSIYRASRMVAEEDGPAFVFKKLRGRYTNQHSAVAVGIRCFYCMSWWIAGGVTLYLVASGDITFWQWPLMWGGTAGAACKIYEWWRR